MEILSPLAGTVWKILVKPGDTVEGGDTLIILESMKMEINVDTILDGVVKEILKNEGDVVQGNEVLVILE